ncbi:hypothetical protein SAMN04489725_11623 [Alicyclobacillus hesperidum]|uniref:Uncharacterized protein n=1 Tax=Alicyclobacillus hesperidum TaxID=89784 RepID=A0A1H2WPG7_9BACL|nr:hypothetical protein [Alicyclobacillus hesperidum]SDW82417.1 hypothetical protein SAMN04489725_11623 [Alicyclobacillus hesperidum]
MLKRDKHKKRQSIIEKNLQELVRKGWLFIDGERDGLQVYKPTQHGLKLAEKRLKSLGLHVDKLNDIQAIDKNRVGNSTPE